MESVTVIRVRGWPAGRDYYFAPSVYAQVMRRCWDVIHVQSMHTLVAPLAMAAARRARIPYAVTFHAGGHSSGFRSAMRPLQLQILRPLLARADRLVALAPFEVDTYAPQLRIPRARFTIIPNGSDLPAPAATVVRESELIASIGRLERYKGHHRVIEILPEVIRARRDARLIIIGSGPEEAALRALANRLGVAERVEVVGVPVADRQLMASTLAKAKLAVGLSEFETQPIAMLEAASLGCRLVVSDAPGLIELGRSGLARCVPARAPANEVAQVVVEELAKPPLREPPALPSWDSCAEALLALYTEMHGRPERR